MFRSLVLDYLSAVGNQVLLNVPDAQHVVRAGEYLGEGIDQSLFWVRDHTFMEGNLM